MCLTSLRLAFPTLYTFSPHNPLEIVRYTWTEIVLGIFFMAKCDREKEITIIFIQVRIRFAYIWLRYQLWEIWDLWRFMEIYGENSAVCLWVPASFHSDPVVDGKSAHIKAKPLELRVASESFSTLLCSLLMRSLGEGVVSDVILLLTAPSGLNGNFKSAWSNQCT